MKYQRWLKREYAQLFADDGPLQKLISDQPVEFSGTNVPLDVQFRPGNKVQFYLGETSILDLRIQSQMIVLSAHPTYKKQDASRFLRNYRHDPTDLTRLIDGWPRYTRQLTIADRFVRMEGRWQSRIAQRFGRDFTEADPWCVIDAQVVIAFDRGQDHEKRRLNRLIDTDLSGVRRAIINDDEIREIHPRLARSAAFTKGKFGDELDFLCVDSAGDVLLVELKPAEAAAGIYKAPLQLAKYTLLWNEFTKRGGSHKVQEEINRLVDQKKSLGLLPSSAPRVRSNFQIRPVLAIGGSRISGTALNTLTRVNDILAGLYPEIASSLRTMVFEEHVQLSWDGLRHPSTP
jgi:hypothetical protein